MRKTKTKITVSKNIIEAANKLMEKDGTICSCHCPISLALNKHTDYHGWFVSYDYQEARTFMYDNKIHLPKVASTFLKKWLKNPKSAVAFSFDISID